MKTYGKIFLNEEEYNRRLKKGKKIIICGCPGSFGFEIRRCIITGSQSFNRIGVKI
jgi:hypothetical protein